MKLIDTIKIRLSDSYRKKIERIDNEDYTIVLQKSKQQLQWQGMPFHENFLNRGLLALKQYYAVAVLDGLNPHAVSDLVDPFWHAHIICTNQYAKFCEDTSGYFMHHVPHDEDSVKQKHALEIAYLYTMDIYGRMFNTIDPVFNPPVLGEERMICWHFNTTKVPEKEILFPQNEELIGMSELFRVA